MKLPNPFKSSDSPGSNKPSQVGSNTIEQSKVIIDNIDDGVILVDKDQVIHLINPAASQICGWTSEEANGISADSVIQLVNDKGEPINDNDNPLHQIFTNGTSSTTSELNIQARDKRQFPISLHVSPLLDKDQQVYQAVAVFSDISAEKSDEKQRADFISTASHEMRTPVAAIEGYLALALNDKVSTIDNRARDYLEKAHSSTQHLGKLFQDLLTSAKAEDGRLTSHPVVVEMGEYLEQITGDLRLVAEKKGLSVEYAAGSTSNRINATKEEQGGSRVLQPLFYVMVDPDRLREVITNLFDNAVKYTPEGKIIIGLTGNDQVAQCYVKDTGPGIPADDLPHLFQKFYRVDNSSTRTVGGTGLGLFICRKIIELYNGRIWAESEYGKGSTFYINLPRLSAQTVTKINAVGNNSATSPATGAIVTPS